MPRKKIAVITAKADDRTQMDIICGVTEAAFAENTDVVVFTNIHNHWIIDKVLNFENIIYDFFEPAEFDGVIVTAEAFMELSVISDVCEKIREAKIPAVVIGGEIDGFHSIYFDEEGDMEKLCEHLITVHKIRNIDILTGGEGNEAALRRVSGCKKAFEKHGIPFDENKVYFGTFWYDSGEKLAKRYLSGELPMPEAVMCANDCMAYELCDVLSSAGVRIPEEITVTGYDCTGGRIYHYPVLTTYYSGRRNAGAEAVNYLLSSDYEFNDTDRFIPGSTCKCGTDPMQLCNEMRIERIGHPHTFVSDVAQFSSAQFSGDLTMCRTLSECTKILSDYFYLLHGAKRLYLCLDKEWSGAEYTGGEFLCCTVNGTEAPTAPLTVSKERLLSAITDNNVQPMIFYFCPLYFQTRLFGCTVTAYDRPDGYDFSFRDWNKTVSNALEFLRMKNDIHYLTQCRRTSSLYDALTGFCNISEFYRRAEEASTEKSGLLAVKMSFFSDREYIYGDNYKSDIIASAARAVKRACTNHEICCRTDKDIFLILCNENRDSVFEKIKVVLHHDLCGKYDENRVMVSFAEQIGCSQKEIDALCRLAENTAFENVKLLMQREKLPQYKKLLELRSCVTANPRNAPDIDAASRRLCVSEGYFRAIYKKCFGISYVRDCINIKIMLARYLLCTTVMSVYMVALQCGYANEKYFARQFGQNMGCSPIQYRKWFCQAADDIQKIKQIKENSNE